MKFGNTHEKEWKHNYLHALFNCPLCIFYMYNDNAFNNRLTIPLYHSLLQLYCKNTSVMWDPTYKNVNIIRLTYNRVIPANEFYVGPMMDWYNPKHVATTEKKTRILFDWGFVFYL
jgi:hypothetical protein